MVKAKLIICDGRDFDDYDLLKRVVDELLEKQSLSLKEVEIVIGNGDGADKLVSDMRRRD